MISKKFLRVAAIVVCLGFITLTFSGVVYAKDKKVQKADAIALLKKPVLALHSLFNVFLNAAKHKGARSVEKSTSGAVVKITGNLKSDKVAIDD
jgi:hypothetical protein